MWKKKKKHVNWCDIFQLLKIKLYPKRINNIHNKNGHAFRIVFTDFYAINLFKKKKKAMEIFATLLDITDDKIYPLKTLIHFFQ